jgi:hypothetical protein
MEEEVGVVDGEIVLVIHDTSYDSPVQLNEKEESEFVGRLMSIYEARG